MSSVDPIYQTYSEVCELSRTGEIWIPSHAISDNISLPLPTKRLSIPAYAYFANCARYLYGEPVLYHPPDRWWTLQAQGGCLLLYAQTRVLPFAEGMAWNKVTLPEETRSIPELERDQEQSLLRLESSMDQVVLPFFSVNQESARHASKPVMPCWSIFPLPCIPGIAPWLPISSRG